MSSVSQQKRNVPITKYRLTHTTPAQTPYEVVNRSGLVTLSNPTFGLPVEWPDKRDLTPPALHTPALDEWVHE